MHSELLLSPPSINSYAQNELNERQLRSPPPFPWEGRIFQLGFQFLFNLSSIDPSIQRVKFQRWYMRHLDAHNLNMFGHFQDFSIITWMRRRGRGSGKKQGKFFRFSKNGTIDIEMLKKPALLMWDGASGMLPDIFPSSGPRRETKNFFKT